MSTGAIVALVGVVLTNVVALLVGVWHLSNKISGSTVTVIREVQSHESRCRHYDPNTGVYRMPALGEE